MMTPTQNTPGNRDQVSFWKSILIRALVDQGTSRACDLPSRSGSVLALAINTIYDECDAALVREFRAINRASGPFEGA